MFSFKSGHQRCSVKKVFLKNFANFTGKHLCWSLFLNKVAGYQACNFIKKRLQDCYFLWNLLNFLRTPILKNICERLFCSFFLMALCSLFTSYIYRPKIECKDEGSYFYKNQKERPLVTEKKFFSVNSFQKILIFHIWVSSENTQCFVGAFLQQKFKF